MTKEKLNQAKDIIATMISWDCDGVNCKECPFHNDKAIECMIIYANSKWRELNQRKE